jgi:hypothetical protein
VFLKAPLSDMLSVEVGQRTSLSPSSPQDTAWFLGAQASQGSQLAIAAVAKSHSGFLRPPPSTYGMAPCPSLGAVARLVTSLCTGGLGDGRRLRLRQVARGNPSTTSERGTDILRRW